MSDFLTVNQLASQWKLHPITIRRYIREGKLAAAKIGGRVRIEKNVAENMAKTIHIMPRKPQPPHIAKRRPVQAFSETDPIWRLKGIGSSQEI